MFVGEVMSYGALLALICPTFLNGATYKNKKKFLICPLFPNVLRIIIRKTKRLVILKGHIPMGYYKNKLHWKFQGSLFFSCNRALFVQFVCGAQHAKLCAAVQLMAYFLLLFALDCVYKLFGENIVLL